MKAIEGKDIFIFQIFDKSNASDSRGEKHFFTTEKH